MRFFSPFIFSAFLLLFLFSCSSDDGEGSNQGNAKSNYFPLAENNSWVYDSQQLEDGVLQTTSTINLNLVTPTNIDGRDYYPWVQDDSEASASPKISQNNKVTYLSQSFDLSELGLETDEVIEVEDFPILDEKVSANTIFYTDFLSREVGEFFGDGSQPVTLNVYIESKMIGALSSITLFNIIPSIIYNDILHTKTSVSVDAITTIPEESFDFTAGPFNTNFTVVVLEQDVKFIKKSEVQTIDYYFSRDIGPVKNELETKPSNITIEKQYTKATGNPIKATINGTPTDIDLDFENREVRVTVTILGASITVPPIDFDDLPPSFNDLADSLDAAQAEIDDLPNRKTINELEDYELF